VYRGTDPAFVPGPANRIATGVTGSVYHDTAAPNGVTLYYVVRAENSEGCSTGPNNGGVTESNTVRVSAVDTISQPGATSVGDTVRVIPVNDAHVRLSWAAVPGAANYRVFRALSPQGPFNQIGQTPGLYYEDPNQLGNETTWYYDVRAVDACGNEGP
jgi:hypothetical protein